LNRTTVATDPFGKSINYQYDASGNITRITYPDGKQVTYQFDASNRLASFTDWAGKTTSYEYDATNLLTKLTYPNGVIIAFAYDAGGRLISKSDSDISSNSFTIDRNGNRTNATITQPLANRPQNASHTYSYDEANRVQSAGPSTFSFDANGNMTSKSDASVTTIYTYDFENRLKSVTGGTQYFYNGLGVRLQKIEGAETTRFVVDANRALSQVLCETDAEGAIQAYYVYGIGLAYKVNPDGTHFYYSFDPLGSTIAMTDDAKNIVNSYAYDAFGKVTSNSEHTRNPFQFIGQYGVIKELNGLSFMRARYYESTIGRFLQKDTASSDPTLTQSLNLYIYGDNNPVVAIDPKGLSPVYPVGPSYANVAANIETTMTLSTVGWLNAVRPNGVWDYKNWKSEKAVLEYEDFGNFNFGATCKVKFPEEICLKGAGAVQVVTDVRNLFSDNTRIEKLFGAAKTLYQVARFYGDEGKDRYFIEMGFDYYDEYIRNMGFGKQFILGLTNTMVSPYLVVSDLLLGRPRK
jgi:RHS repeat-associated protein